ncbi:MAG: hypothetical protein A2Z78_01255 [Candidatus Nealsonbacteria bacterium RBG_13_36_15]|uniref:Uncharacterized protein n=1 Tax=Candidatus Nealsonbacteria bacterium RBG_13_36_15 TaxID=1801660 RepID=A0A1G2DUR5_9BACT|nr:MAG: hypothetical protein A2Z78_01255 [Candidatus Nealsonbacteria bacterium RBG_13_36_15]
MDFKKASKYFLLLTLSLINIFGAIVIFRLITSLPYHKDLMCFYIPTAIRLFALLFLILSFAKFKKIKLAFVFSFIAFAFLAISNIVVFSFCWLE